MKLFVSFCKFPLKFEEGKEYYAPCWHEAYKTKYYLNIDNYNKEMAHLFSMSVYYAMPVIFFYENGQEVFNIYGLNNTYNLQNQMILSGLI